MQREGSARTTWLQPGSDGHTLDPRVGPPHMTTSLVGKGLMIGQLSLTTSFGLIVVGQDG
jgi:hypothetical protein